MKNKKISPRSLSIVICALFLSFLIGVNMVVNQLPVEKTKFDTTEIGLHTLSDSTKEFVSMLSEDVEIFRICAPGHEDATLTDMLERYASLSTYLHVSTIDTAVYPNFESQYSAGKLANNSIIVTSARRTQIINYADIVTYTAYNGEDYITNAIRYVTTDTLPVLYSLEGHGEKEISDSIHSSLNKAGIDVKTLNLLSTGEIPSDAQCLFINAPEKDLNDNEALILIDYLNNNGKLILITDYNSSSLANISVIMSAYGVSTADGIVMEGSADRCLSGYPYYIIPDLSTKSEITKSAAENGTFALMPLAQAIVKDSNIRDTVKITDLFTTSLSSYVVEDSSYAVSQTAPAAPYALASIIEETYDDKDTKIVWITTSEFLSEDTYQMIGDSNVQLFINAANYLCDLDMDTSLNSKSTVLGKLTMTTSQSRILKILFTGVIPAISVIIGIAVWFKRRQR